MSEDMNVITPEYFKYRLEQEAEQFKEEISRLNNIIKELKLCNSDYYNQLCTLSSKLSLINKYISNSEQELSVDSYYKFKDLTEFDDIKKIIFDKGSNSNENL